MQKNMGWTCKLHFKDHGNPEDTTESHLGTWKVKNSTNTCSTGKNLTSLPLTQIRKRGSPGILHSSFFFSTQLVGGSMFCLNSTHLAEKQSPFTDYMSNVNQII